VLSLPNAKDPDELIRSDPTAWPALVGGAMPVIDFVLQRLGARHDLSSAEGKSAAAAEVAEVLATIASPIEQDHYVQEAARQLKVAEGAVRQMLRREAPQTEPLSGAKVETNARKVPGENHDYNLLALLMRLGELPDPPAIDLQDLDFVMRESRQLAEALDGEIPPHLEELAERARTLMPPARLLSRENLVRAIDEARLQMKKTVLLRRMDGISALQDDAEAWKFIDQLEELARSMNATDQQLPPEREKAGTK
jgi:DNA primase